MLQRIFATWVLMSLGNFIGFLMNHNIKVFSLVELTMTLTTIAIAINLTLLKD